MKLSDIVLSNLVKFGNAKLPKSTAIFNLGSATNNCPNRGKERCQVEANQCYAFKSERRYPQAKQYRERQLNYWESVTARDFIYQFNQIVKLKRNRVKALRFNVSSDLRNQSDINKIESIARNVNVKVYLYTASSHLDLGQFDQTIVNASNRKIWKKYRNKSNFNYYMVTSSERKAKQFESQGVARCRNDCSECNHCLTSTGKIIQVIH